MNRKHSEENAGRSDMPAEIARYANRRQMAERNIQAAIDAELANLAEETPGFIVITGIYLDLNITDVTEMTGGRKLIARSSIEITSEIEDQCSGRIAF